ncbi:hypothetical protein [Candidatus Phytoplasma solani]|uniref:hypothetical protein n=1 Tax=Candidatus Phytoplasma solani TaxID=69896 RepID=UPI00358F85A4
MNNNNNNFFQKHLAIIIIIIAVIVGIGIYYKTNTNNSLKQEEQQEQEEKHLFPPEEKIENDNSKMSSSRTELETEKPKFTITESRFDQIKSYVLSENNNQTLLPNNLSEQEKFEIEKIKRSWKNSLSFLKDEQNRIDKENKTCDEHNAKIQEIKSQYPSLKSQKEQLEQQLEVKNKEINNLKYQRGEISPIYAQTLKKLSNIEIINPKTPNPELETKLKAEISKLQDERLEIVRKIDAIELKIKNLESKQRMYEDMLSGAKSYKKTLEDRFKNAKKQYQDNILSKLNSLYQITSVEE